MKHKLFCDKLIDIVQPEFILKYLYCPLKNSYNKYQSNTRNNKGDLFCTSFCQHNQFFAHNEHLCPAIRNIWHYTPFDIYLLTAVGQTPGGSSTVHIYTQTIHRTTHNKQYTEQQNNLEECGPCPIFAGFTLAFALKLRKKYRNPSVRVAEECQLAR